jgi:hypothetical protein
MVCAATGRFATDPAAPMAGGPIRISLTRLLGPRFISLASVSISGNEITVSNFIDTEQPPQLPFPPADCQTSSVMLAPLPAGTYRVHWKLIDFGPTFDEGTFTFVVGPSTRRRSAR